MFYKQSQFELFPEASPQSSGKADKRFFLTKFSLSLENMIITSVVIIMAVVVSYSFGVERGRQSKALSSKSENFEAFPVAEAKRDVQTVSQSVIQAQIQQEENVEPAQKTLMAGIQEVELLPEEKALQKDDLSVKSETYYTVQVASFKGDDSAQQEAEELRKKGYEIYVIPKGDYKIVCVGQFVQKDEAQSFSRKLKSRYKDCLVRSM